jgi:hypothetical protein
MVLFLVLFVLFLVHIYVSWAVRIIYVIDYDISKADFFILFFQKQVYIKALLFLLSVSIGVPTLLISFYLMPRQIMVRTQPQFY